MVLHVYNMLDIDVQLIAGSRASSDVLESVANHVSLGKDILSCRNQSPWPAWHKIRDRRSIVSLCRKFVIVPV